MTSSPLFSVMAMLTLVESEGRACACDDGICGTDARFGAPRSGRRRET